MTFIADALEKVERIIEKLKLNKIARVDEKPDIKELSEHLLHIFDRPSN